MISIIVVTYNRKALLERCVNSLIAQDYVGDYEILVIDNGSTDGTEDFVNSRFSRNVRCARSNYEVGLSASKNLGIKISRGGIIAFTDDDCFVSPLWLNNIDVSLRCYDIVGGLVLPDGGTNFPSWWRDSLNWQVGLSTAGAQFIPLGSNVAFKRKVFERIGLYSMRINRTSSNLLFGEDNDIIKRAIANGFKVIKNSEMIVYHWIPAERLTLSYLIWRSYKEGESLSVRERCFNAIIVRCLALVVNPARFLISTDINFIFRMIVSIGCINGYWHRRAFIE